MNMRSQLRKLGMAACLAAMAAAPVLAATPTNPALREELLQMRELDQEVRKSSEKGDFSKWEETDAANQKRIKQIVEQYGWPTFAMVGEDGAGAAWLIAQHSDRDKEFQRKVLALMDPQVKSGQASGKHYAYLYDRTHYPQRYGTQGSCVSRDEWQPFDIEEIGTVDERRQALGLPSLSEYAKLFKELCANPHIALHSATDAKRTVPVPRR